MPIKNGSIDERKKMKSSSGKRFPFSIIHKWWRETEPSCDIAARAAFLRRRYSSQVWDPAVMDVVGGALPPRRRCRRAQHSNTMDPWAAFHALDALDFPSGIVHCYKKNRFLWKYLSLSDRISSFAAPSAVWISITRRSIRCLSRQ